MGLSIENKELTTIWSVPLDNAFREPNKELENKWIVEHLKQIADKIESENPKIKEISLGYDPNYRNPVFNVEIYKF